MMNTCGLDGTLVSCSITKDSCVITRDGRMSSARNQFGCFAVSFFCIVKWIKYNASLMNTYVMNTCVILLRGINVGGKNKLPMADLRKHLEDLGFSQVITYIASGNVILNSERSPSEIKTLIEEALPGRFQLDDELIRVLVLTRSQFQTVIDNKPEGFGEQPEKYHSDVIFLMGIDLAQALPIFNPREGVDQIWPGGGVIYSQRLSAQRAKSRLNKIVASPVYKFMTIRSWNTTTQLLEILRKIDSAPKDSCLEE